jgi:hypothetical protein
MHACMLVCARTHASFHGWMDGCVRACHMYVCLYACRMYDADVCILIYTYIRWMDGWMSIKWMYVIHTITCMKGCIMYVCIM